MRKIRHSPSYWADRKRDAMAMLRQLGCPTFFLTISAAETRWLELIVILTKILDGDFTITEEEAELFEYGKRAELVRKVPITCARYFE